MRRNRSKNPLRCLLLFPQPAFVFGQNAIDDGNERVRFGRTGSLLRR